MSFNWYFEGKVVQCEVDLGERYNINCVDRSASAVVQTGTLLCGICTTRRWCGSSRVTRTAPAASTSLRTVPSCGRADSTTQFARGTCAKVASCSSTTSPLRSVQHFKLGVVQFSVSYQRCVFNSPFSLQFKLRHFLVVRKFKTTYVALLFRDVIT